jgi:hypothetical protein
LTESATGASKTLPLVEIARLLVRFGHIASIIVNTDHYTLPLKKELARNRFRASSVNFSF